MILCRHQCKFPNKKIGQSTDLSSGDDSNIVDELTVKCQNDGTYDKDIDDYACTPPCPFPSLPEPEIMDHDWTDNTTKPEIWQQVR